LEARRERSKDSGNGQTDIEGYRERVARAVGMEAGELIASRRDDPRAAMTKILAAFLLLRQDQLPVGEIAKIMDKPEQWVRDSTNYIERRIAHYYARSRCSSRKRSANNARSRAREAEASMLEKTQSGATNDTRG